MSQPLRKKKYIADNPHVVNQIVERDLCVRCGACEPACPQDIIRFNDQALPYITDESKCPTACQRCLKVCPGEEVDLASFDEEMFGVQPHPESISGIVRDAYVSFATDEAVRSNGASGGFVTQLLIYMLERRMIDGALVLRNYHDGTQLRLEPYVARTPGELKEAAKSKYLAVPFLKELKQVEEMEGQYAVVALPCYAHALRKYQKSSKKLRERIKFVIGLYCNVSFEPYILDDLCEFHDIPKQDVMDLEFRGGHWPGGILARMRDGSTKKVLKLEEMRDEFNTLKLLYTPPRCNTCTDFSVEHADIAVGDPWLRGPDGKLLFVDGRTTIITRTDLGEEVVHRAADDGYIKIEKIPMKTWMLNFERSAAYKRDLVPLNLAMRERFGMPVPRYNRTIGRPHKLSTYVDLLFRGTLLAIARRYKWFRRFVLWAAQTPPSIRYFRWNYKRKERKFKAAYPRLERFAERFEGQVLQGPGVTGSVSRASAGTSRREDASASSDA